MRRALASLRSRFRLPRRLAVTREGRWFLLITLCVGAAAVNTGNNLLYLALAMNLSLVILSGILSEWNLRGASVAVRPVGEAFAGREAFLAVTCAPAGPRRPLFALRVSIPIGEERKEVRFPDIPARGSLTRLVSYRPARRGEIPPLACTVATAFPFALFEKSGALSDGPSLLVYPRPAERAEAGSRGRGDDAEGRPAPAGRTGEWIRGARDLVPSDPVRDIHWKASARAGRWMVKEREKESAPVADIAVPAPAPPADFERALSRACRRVLDMEREGRSYRLLIGGRTVVRPGEGDRRRKSLSLLAVAPPGGIPEGDARSRAGDSPGPGR